jgi:glutamate dehydrogenase
MVETVASRARTTSPEPGSDESASDGPASHDPASRRAQVAARVAELATADAAPDCQEFARRYFDGVADEDLAARSVDELAAHALNHWRVGHSRVRGSALVVVEGRAPGSHTVIDIVNDDMPFLVDSVMMALDRHDLGIHLVIHPILRVRRAPDGTLRGLAPDDASNIEGEAVELESWVHIEVDRETNPAALEALRADIERVLADVRAATSDWLKMLSVLQGVCAGLDTAPPPVDGRALAEGKEFLRWVGDQHFTFLAYRAYDLVDDDTLVPVGDSGLGLLRDAPESSSANFARLPAEIRAKAHEPTLLLLTKANSRSTIHRPT